MALATLANVQKPLLQILNANRLTYGAAVGAGAAGVGGFKFDDEIKDACIHADGLVITEGYFQSRMSLRNRFLTASANIAHAGRLPEFIGLIGKAEYSVDGTAWHPSIKTLTKDDIIEAVRSGPGYISSAAFRGQHFFEDDVVYHTSPFFRVETPQYTKTALLQASEAHEPAIIAGALALLYKDASNAPHEYYLKLFGELLVQIKSGSMTLDQPQAMRG